VRMGGDSAMVVRGIDAPGALTDSGLERREHDLKGAMATHGWR